MSAAVFTVALIAALPLSACGQLPGTGALATETRDIVGVDAVDLRTSGDLVITTGDVDSLSITASERAMASLTSHVEDGTLILDSDAGLFGATFISYALTVPSLDRVQITGSGSVTGANVLRASGTVEVWGSGNVWLRENQTTALTVRIDGSGTVTVTGSSASLNLSMDGSGDFHGDQLQTQKAAAEVAGSGSAWLHVTEHLRADVSGSGGLTYAGDPSELVTDVSGSGTIDASSGR